MAVILSDKSVREHAQLLWRAAEHSGDWSTAAYSGKKDYEVKDAIVLAYLLQSNWWKVLVFFQV